MTGTLADEKNAAPSLQPLFHPQSVAVIGASRDAHSMSGTLARNLAESFRGPLFLINPNTDRIGALPAYPSILDTPGPVDLAFIAVPARHVLDAVRQCLAKPVRGIVVISAGFAEIGSPTDVHEKDILELVRGARIPLVGPNCLGILSTDAAAPMNGTFGPSMPPAGKIAIATQSGALGFVLPELLRLGNLGVSCLVSLGNKLDLGENDFLNHWLTEPTAGTILLYLESFQNPRELLAVGRQLSRTRPVVLLKAGRTAAGGRAGGSHTAALVTPDRLADGLCRQAGICRVATLQELFELTSILSRQPLPKCKRVAVLTNAGGPGVLCADALSEAGSEVPQFSPALQQELRGFAPRHASVGNPIDLVATVDPQLVSNCLECLLRSDEIDAVVVIYVPRLPGTSSDIARAVRRIGDAARATKTLLAVFLEREEDVARLQQDLEPIPCLRYPESAARALALAADHANRQKAPTLPPLALSDLATSEARGIVENFLPHRGKAGGWLGVAETQRLLATAGLPIPDWRLADSPEMALRAGEQIGYPVVVKAITPQMLHKSAAGGVTLDIRNSAELSDAWQGLSTRIAGLEGVLVQQYLPGGNEVFLGAKWETGFGHVIGLGTGGVRVERLQDVAFRLLPLTSHDAYDLVRDSTLARICLSADGALTGAGQRLYEALHRLSALIAHVPEIRELDLNPVSLFRAAVPLCVLDARVFVARQPA